MEIVVLAGGGGTRLWPLSSPTRPKPFLPLLGDETLIQRTVHRLRPLATGSAVSVVADGRLAGLVRQQLPDVRIVAEPEGRNTAAAVALAALAPAGLPDDVMVILPADHAVADEHGFVAILAAAAEHLATGAFGLESPLVTLGIEPTRPATEYGYLRPGTAAGVEVAGLTAYPLAAFEEKPDADRAVDLLSEPGIAWNAGIFIWRRRAILAAFEAYAADIVSTIRDGLERVGLAAAYADVRATSIDRAVMEPAAADGLVVMAPADVGWSDLGSWTALLERLGARGTGRVIPAGEPAHAGPADLAVERVDDRLILHDGPRDILATGPVAILEEAAPDRAIVEALISRTSAAEGRPRP
ncbi:MAG TPA: sugar phosphate nucleotidyltransferase [Candidatus Limnocylindrales bacterium]|nr:sugar phosphate nucleotidyltransferase [Candidatus Limnocylindrales bacterium]